MEVRYIREADVRRVLTMADALDAVDAAMRARSKALAQDVPRSKSQYSRGSLRVLSASSDDLGLVGYKATYSAGAGGAHGYLSLVDIESGELRAIIESVHLSVMRTGAASAVATRCLARQDARELGMIGTGRQAMGQIEAVCLVRRIESARVYGRNRERLTAFCAEVRSRLGIDVRPVASVAEAVTGADIVNVITSAVDPVLAGTHLAPGQHINAAGSNAPDRRELDLDAVRRCEVIVVDARDVARNECGDLAPLVGRGELTWDSLPELGEVLTGRAPGRTAPEQITLYESHGMGVQDLYTAQFVLDAATNARPPCA